MLSGYPHELECANPTSWSGLNFGLDASQQMLYAVSRTFQSLNSRKIYAKSYNNDPIPKQGSRKYSEDKLMQMIILTHVMVFPYDCVVRIRRDGPRHRVLWK
ncbi:hypothetical protein PHLGIDRAFT_163302 [Phlebiopsis gigantea 11061_1 CR5-6]|uniref:Uncharacterized protein n=1 Tax=Phlebiopsis gigantea (strain 11061_1 CR5-6) TaxID=745531 RepID=A0A0C3RVE7_PHLG1|nr:hypothetical protein PHLGIDRAFT_163302 [Phlebiopsis gigantea 11061_1 CR5-6]